MSLAIFSKAITKPTQDAHSGKKHHVNQFPIR